jgi:hypothetical protein
MSGNEGCDAKQLVHHKAGWEARQATGTHVPIIAKQDSTPYTYILFVQAIFKMSVEIIFGSSAPPSGFLELFREIGLRVRVLSCLNYGTTNSYR